METYPGELLVGVFPLVFCVDATLAAKAADNTEIPSARSQFDRFLDALAASLLDEPEYSNDVELLSPNSGRRRTVDDVMSNLFREGELHSDQEDDLILGGDYTGTSTSSANTSYEGSELDPRRRSFPFPRLGRDGSTYANAYSYASSSANRNQRALSSKDVSNGATTSFAKTLQEGQGFFQRARIVSISSRHGFPPSKDPTGEDNRLRDYFVGKTLRTSKILAATKRRPIDGILPSGWLEKHAAALPSVILVIVQVSSHQQQHEQNTLLERTVKNLQISLAKKRQCIIRIVGLVQDGISTSMAAEWKQKMAETLEGSPLLTLLDIADLNQDAATSMTMRTLHKTVHDASLRYYMIQTRHTKRKLCELGPARGTPLLLPLCIRYCFKVAMFYEFQWNPEKSLKYLLEAYRHVETYFRYLLQQKEIANSNNDSESIEGDKPKIRLSNHGGNSLIDGESEGVEMSIPTDDDINNLLLNPPTVPDDMVHQCRVLADWLNFKILQSCFTSHTESGLLAASTQLQKHVQAFCNPLRSFVCNSDHAYVDWSFVAHQRMVASQLLERNPPRVLGELGNEYDEVLLRCSRWKSYEAAAEALLRLGAEVRKAVSTGQTMETIVDDMRSRYVGGLDRNGYQPKLQEELKVNHHELALDCLRRSISFYEREVEELVKKEKLGAISCSRSGARMYYLAGGTLLALERYAEAAPFLQKAVMLAKGWKGLEVTIRRMIVECYKNYIPEKSMEDNLELLSLLLDSYFNVSMPINDLQRELENLASKNDCKELKWHHICFNEADESLPFSFTLTFPSGTHATAGDGVQTNLVIKSNLEYDVNVKSITISNATGEVSIPGCDLSNAKNAKKVSLDGIIMPAKSKIFISTSIQLPKNFMETALEKSETATDKDVLSTTGVSRSARPRTAGMTSAAGARLVSDDVFADAETRSKMNPWSQKCLGGTSLSCDGLTLGFFPVDTAAPIQSKRPIHLRIEKKERVPDPNIKRTPFEEDNYVSTCWHRPVGIPLNLGPKCLRVLPPLASMIVNNITESHTGGKVLEGTVNRILLALKAGRHELCRDIAIRLSCTSFLVTSSGTLTKISANATATESDEKISVVDPTNHHVRTPVLVKEDKNAQASMIRYGYEIPEGWILADEDLDSYSTIPGVLNKGDQTYAVLDIFRPSPRVTRIDGVLQPGDDEEGLSYEHSMCQSEIEVSIRYRQERPSHEVQSDKHKSDVVVLTQKIAVTWSQPLVATFSPGLKLTHPCGNRHPTNTVPDANSRRAPSHNASEAEMVLVDGERVTSKCTLEAAAAADELHVDINEIRFENAKDENTPCIFTLLSGKDERGLLYKAHPQDPCRKLILGSKFSLAWMNKVKVKSNYLKGSVSASLGMLSIDWTPSPLKIPDDVPQQGLAGSILFHGPLPLDTPSTCCFMGPPCYIEHTPFETTMDRLPDILEVAMPFTITYYIKNKTSLDQKLKVSLSDTTVTESLCFMISGLVTGEVSLGPFETHTLSYTAIATRSGLHPAPPICVSSVRYNTWLIHESRLDQNVFVAP